MQYIEFIAQNRSIRYISGHKKQSLVSETLYIKYVTAFFTLSAPAERLLKPLQLQRYNKYLEYTRI